MKQIMALLLASGLMVPLFPAPAFCAKSSAPATHKKASGHKHHAGSHTKASSASTASSQKPTSGTTTQE